MQLLGIRRIRPARRNPVGRPLKGELPQSWLQADNHPPVDVLVDPHPEHLAVELREGQRIRAVDHCLFEASNHSQSMPAPGSPQGSTPSTVGIGCTATGGGRACSSGSLTGPGWLWSSPRTRLDGVREQVTRLLAEYRRGLGTG